MMRELSLSLLFCLLALSACDKNKQVLATFEQDGKIMPIVRQELNWLLQLKSQNAEKIKPTIQTQYAILKEYILTQIISKEAMKKKLQNEQAYKDSLLLIKEKANLIAYNVYLQEKNTKARYKLIELQLIVLPQSFVPNPPDTKKKRIVNASFLQSEKIEALLKELNDKKLSSQDIEKKVWQYSQHPIYKHQGGYIDPICISCSTTHVLDFMEKELQTKEINKFFPVMKGNEIWIIRVIKKYSCDVDELYEKYEAFYRKVSQIARRIRFSTAAGKLDQNNKLAKSFILSQAKIESLANQKSKWLTKQRQRNIMAIKMKQLKAAQKFDASEVLASSNNRVDWSISEVLYTLSQKPYTYGMFLQEYPALAEKKSSEQIAILRNLLIPYALLEKESTFHDMQKKPIFHFVRNFIQKRALMLAYYRELRNGIKITKQEVKTFYNSEKNRLYNGLSYAEAKQSAQQRLKQTKLAEKIKKIHESLAKDYKLVIKSKLLKAG